MYIVLQLKMIHAILLLLSKIEIKNCGGDFMVDKNTMLFKVDKEKPVEPGYVLASVYQSLKEKGYNPISQLIGYIMSGDPTYITNYNGARTLITSLDRDELLEEVFVNYLEKRQR